MKHCRHCGHTVVKVHRSNVVGRGARTWRVEWMHLVAGHLSVATLDCDTPEPREADEPQ